MLKVSMLASLIAGLAMGTNVASSTRVSPNLVRDTEIIVEVNRSNETLTEEGVNNTQQIVMNNIRNYATSNFRVISQYSEVANAFAISVNSNYVELIKNVPGVKSVTVNKLHWTSSSENIALGDGGDSDEYGGSENISAETMKKGNDTNDGEGTIIAILDNEFYLRGATSNEGAWNHETYSALDSTTKVRYNGHPANWKKTYAYKIAKSKSWLKEDNKDLGNEGSLYFNSKVPFYFDYGGEKTSYGADPTPDLDVSSELSYHGSHVASIASGNAPTYKGIAPKAQLVCMKVFTNYKATGVDKLMGFSSSSGAYDIPIMNALEDCIKLGVDGINMSLGSNLNDFDEDTITVKTLAKLANEGILTSISAGNSGKQSYQNTGAYSNWTSEMVETGILSGYANNSSAMTVASGQPTKIFYEAAFQMGNDIVAYDDQIVNREYYDSEYEKEYKMADLVEKYGENLSWVYVPGFGASSDYSTDPDKSVAGKIAVVNRGSISFADKYAVAKSKGAIGLVVINNDPTNTSFNFRMSFGDGFRPSMPCALVLYKDKEYFSKTGSGTLSIISKLLSENPNYGRVSTFSTDGATFDLDLKPEITAPGDSIKGAVPPQKNEDKTEDRKYKVYEFLSGTSMSAPNYAGAQSVVLSKVAAQANVKESTIASYRKTVDMRLMSTAEPMQDKRTDPEHEDQFIYSITSPRKQGAGMVNLGAAYRTNVYLEGFDLQGNPTGKSKIALRNSEKINQGIIDLKFLAHNESESTLSFNVKFNVMRPAIVNNNEIVTGDYNYRGEADAITGLPGYTYYLPNIVEGGTPYERHTDGVAEHNDVFYVSRDIEYYKSAQDCLDGKKTTIKSNRYVNTGTKDNVVWEVLPGLDYQSIFDEEIASYNCGTINIQPGNSTIQLEQRSLSAEAKKEILDFYKYGTYLEGYITLESTNENVQPSLSMPYMGFFAGDGQSYKDAPVFEPFNFEKDPSTVYPSDLVNDIAQSLIGKNKADMSSMWVAGYLKDGDAINTSEILANNDNFANLSGFSLLGTDADGNYYENASEHLYVGSSYFTNTMVVQQFMLRSVYDNYFTIVNKNTGERVYKSALQDMLFGDGDWGQNYLFKSHIDDNYLGSGYISHRAYAVIPLYDEHGQPFPSGEYTISFNYLVSGINDWVSKDYTLHIDSDAPEVSSLSPNGDKLRINIREKNLTGVTIGRSAQELTNVVKVDDDNSYIEIEKSVVEDILFNDGFNRYQGSGRLFIKLTDAAKGSMGCIVRFEYDDDENVLYDKYVMVEHHSLVFGNDFEDDGQKVTVVTYNSASGAETPVTDLEGALIVSRGPISYNVANAGCGGNIVTTSVVLSTLSFLAILGIAISQFRRKKFLGGND